MICDIFCKIAKEMFPEYSEKLIEKLVIQLIDGSLKYLEKSNKTPSELVKDVASKGGATEAALEILMKNNDLEQAIKRILILNCGREVG